MDSTQTNFLGLRREDASLPRTPAEDDTISPALSHSGTSEYSVTRAGELEKLHAVNASMGQQGISVQATDRVAVQMLRAFADAMAKNTYEGWR